jgi:hypothetical protein
MIARQFTKFARTLRIGIVNIYVTDRLHLTNCRCLECRLSAAADKSKFCSIFAGQKFGGAGAAGTAPQSGQENTAIITDGRFSGATRGPCIGHITPEATAGGLLASVIDADLIEIDIPERKLELKVSTARLKQSKKTMPIKQKPVDGVLKRYRHLVGSVWKGARLDRFKALRSLQEIHARPTASHIFVTRAAAH